MLKLALLVACIACSFQAYSVELKLAINKRDFYRFKDTTGQWTGKDIELANAVFRRTSHTFEIIEMPWPRVLMALESGAVDMTLSALNSKERKVYARFSKHAFRYNHYLLFVMKNKLKMFNSVTTLADLTRVNTKIGALRGALYSNTYRLLLEDERFSSQMVYLDYAQRIPEFASKGRVDAFIYSEIEAKYLVQNNMPFNHDAVPFIRVTADEEAGSYLMFCKKTVSQALVDEFDHALLDLHQSGDYDMIIGNEN